MKKSSMKSILFIIMTLVIILPFFQYVPQSFATDDKDKKPIVKSYDYPKVYPPMLGDVYPYQFVNGLEINDKKFNFTSHSIVIPTQVLPLYYRATIKLNIFDERTVSEVEHAAIFFIQSDRDYPLSTDTYISWDRSNGVEFNDPTNVLGEVSAIFVKHNTNYGTATFSFSPIASMNTSKIITRLWDYRTAISENIVTNALQFGYGVPKPVEPKVDTNIVISSHISDFTEYLASHNFKTPALANDAYRLEHMFDNTDDGRMYWKIDKAANELTMVLESPIGHPYLIKHEKLQKYLYHN